MPFFIFLCQKILEGDVMCVRQLTLTVLPRYIMMCDVITALRNW